MYTLATNNINNAYYYDMLYALTFPDGKIWEILTHKTVKSGKQLTKKETQAYGDIWIYDVTKGLNEKYPQASLQISEFQVEWYVIDRAGNKLGHRER